MSDTDEEFVPEEELDNPAGAIKKLRERLTQAEKEKQENLDGWQRARADFANLKKDEETRRGYTEERIKASFAEEIIPVLDSFEMAEKHAVSKEFELIYKQLLEAIKRMGMERFGKPGEPFDPHKHEAIREETVANPADDHTVVSIERSGYSIGNHIIRPAHVSVGTYKK